MPYSLSFTENIHYLHIGFTGNFRAGDVKALWKELGDYLQAHPQTRVLVEEQPGAEGRLDTLEVYETAEFLANATHTTRIALLYQAGVTRDTLRQALFGETVAVNRGLNLKVFFTPGRTRSNNPPNRNSASDTPGALKRPEPPTRFNGFHLSGVEFLFDAGGFYVENTVQNVRRHPAKFLAWPTRVIPVRLKIDKVASSIFFSSKKQRQIPNGHSSRFSQKQSRRTVIYVCFCKNTSTEWSFVSVFTKTEPPNGHLCLFLEKHVRRMVICLGF
jgi:hypothetical protein